MQRRLSVAGALSAEEFHALMADFVRSPKDGGLALAVSGGPDSMALAFAVQRWCRDHQVVLPYAFIVDHQLRDESVAEAEGVKQHLLELGFRVEILRWEHEPITARLHNEARRARYRLLLEACHRHSATNLLFGHQRDDQAETILMRLAKGTGLDGLAGIPADSVIDGVRLLRPFLGVPKERLIATCEDAGISFVADPSNASSRFARGRLRRVMPLLAEEGFSVERLIDFAARAAETRDALDHYMREFLGNASRRDAWGVITIDKTALLSVPRAIALRALGVALQAVHTEAYAPTHESLSQLLKALKDEKILSPKTLNGCLLSESKKQVHIFREFAAIKETTTLAAGQSLVWDGRWRVGLAKEAAPEIYTIRPLGNPPHEILDRLAPDLRRQVPQGRARATLPALWLENEIKLIPFLNRNSSVTVDLLGEWPPTNKN